MPQQLSPDQLDVIQHPTLGQLSFPKTMPAEQRNSIIDGMMAQAPKPAQPATSLSHTEVLEGGFDGRLLGTANMLPLKLTAEPTRQTLSPPGTIRAGAEKAAMGLADTLPHAALTAATFGMGGALSKIAGAYFGTEMLSDVVSKAPQLVKAAVEGRKADFNEMLGATGVESLFGYGGLNHNATVEHGTPAQVTKPLDLDATKRQLDIGKPQAPISHTVEAPQLQDDPAVPQVGQPKSDARGPMAPRSMGDKAAKIEAAQVKDNKPWLIQSYSSEISRTKAIIENPKATIEERAIAASQMANYQDFLDRTMGPQSTVLKPGQEVPRSLAPIKSELPPRMPVAEPTEPDARPILAPEAKVPAAKPVPVSEVPKDLQATVDEAARLTKRMSKLDLDDPARKLYQSRKDALQQPARMQLNAWGQALGDRVGQAVVAMRQRAAELGDDTFDAKNPTKIGFLSRAISRYDEAKEQQDAIRGLRQAGGEGMVHGVTTAIGEMPPAPGIAHGARALLNDLEGRATKEVADPKAKGSLTELSELGKNAQAKIEAIRADVKERMQSDLPYTQDELADKLGQIKTYEDIVSKEYRPATKRVAAAATGKIPVGATTLPWVSQKLWETEYGGPKGRGLPTLDMLQQKLEELKTRKAQYETFATQLGKWEARQQGQRGGVGGTQDYFTKLADQLDKRIGATLESQGVGTTPGLTWDKFIQSARAQGIPAWNLTKSRPAGQAGWLAPDGHSFIEAEMMDHYTTMYKTITGLDRNEEAGDLTGSKRRALNERQNTVVQAAVKLGWIRKSGENMYEVHDLDSDTRSVLKDKLDESIANGSLRPNKEKIIYLDSHMGARDYIADTSKDWVDRPWQPIQFSTADYLENPDLDQHIGRALREMRMAGVSGAKLLTGMSAGAISGGLAGGALAGPIGAGVGAAVGTVAGAVVAGLWDNAAALGGELSELRHEAGLQVEEAKDVLNKWVTAVSKDPRVADPMFSMKGEFDRKSNYARKATASYFDAGVRLPEADRIKVMDAIKRGDMHGMPQEWQDFALVHRAIEDDKADRTNTVMQERAQLTGAQFNPMPYLQNHFRALWKKIPGGPDSKVFTEMTNRFMGSRGFLKEHVLPDVSSGLAKGGELWDSNPVANAYRAYDDQEHFIQGMQMANHYIKSARVGGPGFEYFKTGEKVPDNYFKLNDKNLQSYFSVPEGLVKAGEWYANDKSLATMFGNYASPDLVRSSKIGRAYFALAHPLSTMRLFGPFHAFSMTWNAISAQAGQGYFDMNEGLRNSDIGQIVRGAKDAVTAPVAPVTSFRLGRAAQAADFDYNNFINSSAGQKFAQNFPNAENEMRLLWHGGGRNFFVPDPNYNTRFYQKFIGNWSEMKDAYAKDKTLAGTAGLVKNIATAPFALASYAMTPLFETYIPALKLGVGLRDIGQALDAKRDDILAGKTTEATVAREVVRRTEDFFGEFNLDNLFLNRTQTALMQGYYRSFGWRFGTMDAGWRAMTQQTKNIMTAVGERKLPVLDRTMAHWLGMLTYTGLASAVYMKYVAGKNPSSISDLLHPQTGVQDERGKPLRFDWANYMSRDIPKIVGSKTGLFNYATGGERDLLQSFMEGIHNRKFDGSYVVDPRSNDYKQFAYRLAHAIVPVDTTGPATFMQQNVKQFTEEGLPRGQAMGLVALGTGPSSRSIDLTDAEQEAGRLASLRAPGTYTEEQLNHRQAMRQITSAIRNNNSDWGQIVNEHIKAGTITPNTLDQAITEANEPYLMHETKVLGLEDVLSVMDKANPTERQQLRVVLASKMGQLDKIEDPAKLAELMRRISLAMRAD